MGSASSSRSKAASGSGACGPAASSSSSPARRLAVAAGDDARSTDDHRSAVEEDEEVPEACNDCDHCKFMMGGACRYEYVRARRCSAEAEFVGLDPVKVERCLRAGAALVRCVSAHEEYYRPYIRALEKEQEARRRFDHLAGAGADAEEV